MKIYKIIVPALSLLLMSCGSGKPKKITFDNSTTFHVKLKNLRNDGGKMTAGIGGKLDYSLIYDVALKVNGVDFGVINGGESKTMEVPNAGKMKVDKFEIQKNEDGNWLYYMHEGERRYVNLEDEKWSDDRLENMSRADILASADELTSKIKEKGFEAPLLQDEATLKIGGMLLATSYYVKKKKQKGKRTKRGRK
jgi:hypothetical protein